MSNPTRLFRGKLTYNHSEDGEWGREWFTVSVQPDGTRTIRCLCEMDHVALTRDVTYTVNKDFQAIECFVRVISENKFIGSGWFDFHDDHATGEVQTLNEGRVSQRFETPGRTNLFGSHPICIDIWKSAHVKTERPGETQVLGNCFSSSLITNGAGGPLLVPKTYDMSYVGEANLEVASGAYDCVHFNWATGDGRVLNLYSQPGDWLAVRVEVPFNGRYFELVEFEILR